MNYLAMTFEQHEVRIVMRDGEPWWVLADVCEVLELEKTSNVAARLDEDEKGAHSTGTLGGYQQMIIVSEPGLYKLLMTSRKPQAKRFDRWVRHEVLPQIRKTGSYGGALPTLDVLGDLFDAKLEPVHRGMAALDRGLADVHVEVAEVRGNVTFLARRFDDMVPRRDFSANTRRGWIYAIWKFYCGSCPCCREIQIVANGVELKGAAHADHFNGRERTAPTDGWCVCVKCNYRLARDDQYKESARPHFRVFQDNCRRLFGTQLRQSERKRKCSRLVNNRRQSDFLGLLTGQREPA